MPVACTKTGLAIGVVLAVCLGAARPARASGPADPLLRLVPPDAGLTVAVEDLKGHARAVFESPLYRGFLRLPAVRAWLASERGQGYRQAKARIESVFKTDLGAVRDGLLGEAAVLTLRTPPGGRPEDARGLLLLRVPDRAMLDRAVAVLNAAQTKKGELARVSPRQVGGVEYHAREFRDGKKPDEFYAHLADRVFAWSNSEDLIRGAIDRQARGSGGLDGVEAARQVRGRLPSRSAVSVFVDPRFLERVLASSPRAAKPEQERLFALLGRYLAAVRYAGAAVAWRDGPVLHTEEVVDPAKLSPGLRRWGDRTDRPDPALARVPPTALAAATAHVDFGVLLDALADLVPEKDRTKWENLVLSLNGMLLGSDLHRDVAPRLGPGATVYLDRPEPDGRRPDPSVVVAAEVGGGPEGARAAAALENALRTILALYGLDEKHGGGKLRVETKDASGGRLTALSPESPFAFAAADGRFVLASTEAAVARALGARTDPSAGSKVERLRAAAPPGATTFAWADLAAIYEFAAPRREALARASAARQNREEDQAARDLDQALALIGLFDAAVFSSAIEPGFVGVHRSLGLVAAPSPRR